MHQKQERPPPPYLKQISGGLSGRQAKHRFTPKTVILMFVLIEHKFSMLFSPIKQECVPVQSIFQVGDIRQVVPQNALNLIQLESSKYIYEAYSLYIFERYKIYHVHIYLFFKYQMSSVGEWLRHSLAVLGIDGLSLLTASQRCDGLNSPYA